LLTAGVLVGVLLAIFGQVYQTGADPYGLFLGWALLILPWVLIGRQAGLCMLLSALANLALILYWTQVLHPPAGWWQLSQLLGPLAWLGTTLTDSRLAGCVFALNAAILVAWESQAARGASWMQSRWFPRVTALLCFTVVLIQTLWIAVGAEISVGAIWSSPLLFIATVAAFFSYYRDRQRDLLILTFGLVGCIMVMTSLIARSGFDDGLMLAVVVIAQTAGAAYWLRSILSGWETAS
jgi:uncharacterized membrane protein